MSSLDKRNRPIKLAITGVFLNGMALLFYISQLEPPLSQPKPIVVENYLKKLDKEALALRDGLGAYGVYLEHTGNNATSILYTNFISHLPRKEAFNVINELRIRTDKGNATAQRQLIQSLLSVTYPKGEYEEARRRALEVVPNSDTKTKHLLARGRDIAPQFCGSCHIYPPPSVYHRTVWAQDILPDMEFNIGLRERRTRAINMDEGWEEVFSSHALPDSTPISVYDWTAIQYYYLASAPEVLPPIKSREPIAPTTSRFKATISKAPIKPSVVMVKIDPERKMFYAGDMDSRRLYRLDSNGKIVDQMDLGLSEWDAPIDVIHTPDSTLVTTVGFLMNSDRKHGSLVRLNQRALTGAKTTLLLENLRRPTDLAVEDLNGDGRDDLLICEHGFYLGRFCWWENTKDGYKPHELLRQAGSLNARVADFNKDNRPDIALITSQSREGIHLFMNEGTGQFAHRRVVENHPAWGNSHLEIVDFEGDGDLDLLATNGDNGDIDPPPFKAYHGIRLYLNNGRNEFKEAFYWPQNGAFGALPEDFDGDGDMDILAISYFPNYIESREESLVYLENQGGLKFKASTFPEVNIAGRWLVMDKGDLDGDGDTDVVLGAFNEFPERERPCFVREARKESKAAILILTNTTQSVPSSK